MDKALDNYISSPMNGRVLLVAGSDSGGGAGIQGDLKTVTALGGYGATAITALTVQNTHGVQRVEPVAPDLVAEQMAAVLDDIGADCIKTGMLYDETIINAVCDIYEDKATNIPLVVDPVMVATSGHSLFDHEASRILKMRLLLHTSLLTPNVPEAEFLSSIAINTLDDMVHAAAMMITLGPQAVLLKGGHMADDIVRDVLVTEDGIEIFETPRQHSMHTHGTGCTLASAIATGIAQGLPLYDAVERGRAYVGEAIRSAPGYGSGHGPLNHAHTVRKFP